MRRCCFAALLLLLASCAKDSSELKPFPCGKDGSCPTGWYCVPQRGCAELADLTALKPFPCTETKGALSCPTGWYCVTETGCMEATDLPRLEPFPCRTEWSGAKSCAEGFFCVTNVGCTRDLEGHIPFPCPTSGACPSGLACLPGKGCAHAVPDAPCSPSVDCSSAGSDFTCRMGICAQECTNATCPSGRSCSTADSTCLLDCTSGQTCPAGLECQPLWYGGRKGCLPPGMGPMACRTVTTSQSCTPVSFVCPDFSVTCKSGSTSWKCPRHANCVGTNSCACGYGYSEKMCSGENCPQGKCPADFVWGCKINPDSLGCADATGGFAGACTCIDGRTLQFSCSSPSQTCESLCQGAGPTP